jgi:hypothetical protein
MKPAQSIQIQLVNGNGKPLHLGNVKLEIHFFTHGNFRYAFGVGLTDEKGYLKTSYSDVEKERREDSEYNLMDYNTKLDDCDSTVKIVILSGQELRERNEKALRYFDKPLDWAKNWPSNSKVKTQPVSVELRDQITHVQIPCELAD